MIRIDIVILNYNTKQLLRELLPEVIAHSNIPGVKVVVADNCSTDGSAEMLVSEFPDIELVQLSENFGFAGGYNRALKNRDADYFILLNSDAVPAENWLLPLMNLAASNPAIGAIQPKLLDYRNREKFEYAGASGGFMDKFGYPFCRGRIFGNVEPDTGQYNNTCEIFWATGACFMVKREAWEICHGLDDAFFAHMEEIDLCWRMQLEGFRIYACPQSVVYHIGGATLSNASPKKTFLNFRNNLLMLYKNLHADEKNRIIFQRKMLDGLAAVFFILQGRILHVPQVWKAHRAFAKMKLQTPCATNAKPLNEIHGVFHGGLVWNYFARNRKTFAKLFSPQ